MIEGIWPWLKTTWHCAIRLHRLETRESFADGKKIARYYSCECGYRKPAEDWWKLNDQLVARWQRK